MSLKIIHTADWHLGQTFFEYDRSDEHERFLSWLRETLVQKDADVLLVCGDLFDVSNPPASAQKMFFTFLKEINSLLPSLQVICIAGNHDSAPRLEAPRPLLDLFNVSVVGMVPTTPGNRPDYEKLVIPLTGKDGSTEAWCLAIPYLRPGDLSPAEKEALGYAAGVSAFYREGVAYAEQMRQPGQALIATGHLHTADARLSEEDKSERPIMGGLELIPASAFPEELVYTALGHIHRPQTVAGRENVRFAGSPLPMSFSEIRYNHQVMYVEIDNGKTASTESLEIPVSVNLLSIPGKPMPLPQVIDELEKLPENLENKPYPYLRVRVLLEGPEPSLRYEVEKALENKAVRLAKIEVTYAGREASGKGGVVSPDTLQKLQPLEIFSRKYQTLYGDAIPEELTTLFNEVVNNMSSL